MNPSLSDPAFWSRVQFGSKLIYPQLTMGLAWFLVYWKWRALKAGEEKSLWQLSISSSFRGAMPEKSA
jgi:cytochrome bd-type quinol oxidase subunit 1